MALNCIIILPYLLQFSFHIYIMNTLLQTASKIIELIRQNMYAFWVTQFAREHRRHSGGKVSRYKIVAPTCVMMLPYLLQCSFQIYNMNILLRTTSKMFELIRQNMYAFCVTQMYSGKALLNEQIFSLLKSYLYVPTQKRLREKTDVRKSLLKKLKATYKKARLAERKRRGGRCLCRIFTITMLFYYVSHYRFVTKKNL